MVSVVCFDDFNPTLEILIVSVRKKQNIFTVFDDSIISEYKSF